MTKRELYEKVIYQLESDWNSRHHRMEAIKLLEQIPMEKLKEYMEDVKFDAPKVKTFSNVL